MKKTDKSQTANDEKGLRPKSISILKKDNEELIINEKEHSTNASRIFKKTTERTPGDRS